MSGFKKQDQVFLAEAYEQVNAPEVENQLNEASGQSDPDITVWTKKGKHNYDAFLAANEDRIGKPMIDGGVKAGLEGSERNGQPVEGVIYCGAGCVLYKERGTITFGKVSSGFLNTSDGSASWSQWKYYGDSGSGSDARVNVKDASQLKAFAKALAVAANLV